MARNFLFKWFKMTEQAVLNQRNKHKMQHYTLIHIYWRYQLKIKAIWQWGKWIKIQTEEIQIQYPLNTRLTILRSNLIHMIQRNSPCFTMILIIKVATQARQSRWWLECLKVRRDKVFLILVASLTSKWNLTWERCQENPETWSAWRSNALQPNLTSSIQRSSTWSRTKTSALW